MKNSAEIEVLREKIRQDMIDYKLFHTDRNVGVELSADLLFGGGDDNKSRSYFYGFRWFFAQYLNQQIDNDIAELKKIIEGDKK